MKHLYFFVSTNSNDAITTMTVLANNSKKALSLALRSFANNGYVGEPQMLAI